MDRITQLENQVGNLSKMVSDLSKIVSDLQSGNTIPLGIEQALLGRGFSKGSLNTTNLTGIMRLIAGVLSVVAPKTGANTYYVSLTSGGPVTTAITLTNGVHTA